MQKIRKYLFMLIFSVFMFPTISNAANVTATEQITPADLIEVEDIAEVKGDANTEAVRTYILNAIRTHESEIDLSAFTVTKSDVKKIYSEILCTNADLWYADLTYSILYNADTEVVVKLKHFYLKEGKGYAAEDEIADKDNVLSDEKLAEHQKKLDDVCNKIKEQTDKFSSTFEKLLFVHDYIIENAQYDYGNYLRYGLDPKKLGKHDFDAYGVLVNGVGVCQGYTLAFNYVCEKLALVDTSVAYTDSHEWSQVLLDGSWYNVDLTNDEFMYDVQAHAKHANFLKSDSALGITDNTGKDCTSTKYDGLAINRVCCHLEKFGNTYYYVYGSRVYSFTIKNENIETVKDTGIVLYGAWDYTMIRCVAGEDGSLGSILYNGKNDVYVYNVTQNKFYCCNVPEKRHIFSVAYSANPDADDFEGVDVDDSVFINPYIVQYSYRFYNQDDNSSCLEENDKVAWPDASRELETDEDGNVIIKVPVTALAISSTKKTIALNEVLYLNAAYYPTNATIANITWTSSDENIATVTKLGVVHPKNVGQTTITYKVNDDLELSCIVDVVNVGTIVSPDTDSDFSVTGPASAEVSDLVTDDEEIKKAPTGVQTAENSDKEEDDVLRNQWVVQDVEEYYYTADGSLAKGFVMIEDELHYFNKKNQLVYGWFKVGKKKYYSNSVGVVSTGLVKIGKKKYYFSNKGVMKTGLQKIGKKKKKTYYFNKKGVMQTGWVKVKGKWKFFNKKGVYVKGKKK